MSEQAQPAPDEDIRIFLARMVDTPDIAAKAAAILNEALIARKKVPEWCPNCKKRIFVEILDTKNALLALEMITNQGKGRPDVAQMVETDRVVFIREVHE